MFRATFVLASLAASTLAFPPMAKAAALSPQWGGNGGGAYAIECSGYAFAKWMQGVTVRRGDVIDRMVTNCTSGVGHFQATPWVGGSGGTVTEVRLCNGNDVVTGAIAFSGQYFNGAHLLCNSLSSQKVGNFGSEYFINRFGTGGNVNTVFRCPIGTAAAGFRGGVGNVVDSAQLICLDIP